jgi:hypothetical protein
VAEIGAGQAWLKSEEAGRGRCRRRPGWAIVGPGMPVAEVGLAMPVAEVGPAMLVDLTWPALGLK